MLSERSCAGIAANPRLKLLLVTRPMKHFNRNGDGW